MCHDLPMRGRGLLGACFLALSLASGPARGNGRFPEAQQLVEDPSDPSRLLLRATFGFLVSFDRGASWGFLCEAAIGYSGDVIQDPSVGITAGGRFLAGLFEGLTTSATGCTWPPQPQLVGFSVADLSVDKSDPTRVVLLASSPVANSPGQSLNRVFESTDNAASFAPLGRDLRPDLAAFTLDPSPSDTDRLYVSGLVPAEASLTGVLLRSRDRGRTFEELAIPMTDPDNRPFIAAVHPTDPDVLFVRTDGPSVDRLFHTADGGESWTLVFAGEARMLGFALSPDGTEVLVGFSRPPNPADPFDDSRIGLWRSSTRNFSFERIYDSPVTCVTWTNEGVYACLNRAFTLGTILGIAPDARFTLAAPAPFLSLLRPAENLAPSPDCDPTTIASTECPERFRFLCAPLGINGCFRDDDAGPDASDAADASVLDAGAIDASMGGRFAARGGTCTLGWTSSPSSVFWLLVSGFALRAWRRRRARR